MELWARAMKGYSEFSKLQHYWNLSIRLFIQNTCCGWSLPLCKEADGVFYKPRHGKYKSRIEREKINRMIPVIMIFLRVLNSCFFLLLLLLLLLVCLVGWLVVLFGVFFLIFSVCFFHKRLVSIRIINIILYIQEWWPNFFFFFFFFFFCSITGACLLASCELRSVWSASKD